MLIYLPSLNPEITFNQQAMIILHGILCLMMKGEEVRWNEGLLKY